MAKKLSKAPLTKTSPSVRHEAGVGLKEPSNLTKKQIQSLWVLDVLSGLFRVSERSECGLILMAERSPS